MRWYVRFGEEWHAPNEFIRPNDAMVMEAAEEISLGSQGEVEAALRLWDYVCREIRYPVNMLTGESTDYHLLKAFPVSQGLFGPRFLITYASEEFFQFPSETLAWKVADCDGSSILLGSLLRTFMPAEAVSVMVGSSQGSEVEADHAWVEAVLGGQKVIMETTLSSLPADAIPRAVGVSTRIAGNGKPNYLPFVDFNDTGFNERLPLVLARANERAKLAMISSLWGWPTKAPGG